MHDQTEKMIRLICFFALQADNLAGFIMQSLLGQAFLFSGLHLLHEVSIQGGGGIMSIRRVYKYIWYMSESANQLNC